MLTKKKKIFCIGAGKTGTSSLWKTFQHLGYKVGGVGGRYDLVPIPTNSEKNIEKIIEYGNSDQEFFQDCPFCYPDTYKHVEKEFPDAKFILTVRPNAEIWVNSLIQFLAGHMLKIKPEERHLPSVKDKVARLGHFRVYEIFKYIYKTPDEDIFNKEILMSYYENYNKNIKNYFKDKKDKLLIIDLSEKDSFNRLLNFLNLKDTQTNGLKNFYHWNKSTYKT